MNYKLAVIPGDGIGPDIIREAKKVLNKVGEIYGHNFEYTDLLAGGAALDAEGIPLPQKTMDVCKESDSVLLGAVGGPKWDNLDGKMRPEQALLGLRRGLGLFANLRPAVLFNELKAACPLKDEIIGDDGLDIMCVRELTGGIYFGKRGTEGTKAFDTLEYSEEEVRRIAIRAFDIAMKRNKKVTSVDKANILDSSRLWRKVVDEVAKDYPEVSYEHMYVDNAAMQLIRYPKQFDVILTGNMFGDILSDEASMITGSIGMLPSASLGETGKGMYEPIHGSAPDIAGQNIANPIATILSVSMMLRYSFNLEKEADAVENAVKLVLEKGYRTKDICAGAPSIGTDEMGDLIVKELK
ncbi:3-isopropylmalate dehydrogenase [Natranaerovirga pectinivora]|uniref:3-isopropylmalate dehydrogenase n=1 Tax=Natranaerovirga pectinivora TaxID=682400 RepID=A0A4R3MP78_9FIRM|nr:3-isopropylmalate dehydrogenase [Natranaerovirga pectinivora]TCT16332.1 3-isopropylmalate dehydrogenase [Natranaerovirga pectinivora]